LLFATRLAPYLVSDLKLAKASTCNPKTFYPRFIQQASNRYNHYNNDGFYLTASLGLSKVKFITNYLIFLLFNLHKLKDLHTLLMNRNSS